MYSEQQAIRAALRPSPSLVNNNLAPLGSGLAYIHTRSAAIVPALPADCGARIDTRKVDTQDPSLVQCVCACIIDGASLLVLGNEAGLQVWDESGSCLLYVWRLPRSAPPSDAHADYVRSLAFNMSEDGHVQLCAGCSSGAIQVFDVAPGPLVRPAGSLAGAHGRPVTALASAFQCRRGGWGEDLGPELVSADDAGCIRLWRAVLASSYARIGAGIEAGAGCTGLAVRRGFIIAGCLDGCVRIYSLAGKLRNEIVAHARWLSALDVHPGKDWLVTAAEDCTLAVWQLPIGGAKAACLLSVCCLHEPLTGVAWCGEACDDVAAVAYDVDALTVWRRTGGAS